MQDLKTQILSIARKLSNIYGIKRITMERIAEECGISKKTIYKYFKNKDHLINVTVDEMISNAKNQMIEIYQKYENPKDIIMNLLEIPAQILKDVPEILLDDVRKYYPKVEKKLHSMREQYSEVFISTYQKGVKEGLFKNINPAIVKEIINVSAEAVLNTNFILKNNLTVSEVSPSLRELLMTGIVKA